MKKLLLPLIVLVTAAQGLATDRAFLFVHFKGEATPMTEQIYFGISEDGRNWEALNNEQPVLVSNVGEKGVRDPHMLRSSDGKKFFIIATDLSIHFRPSFARAANSGSKSIVIWESEDLVKWSEARLVQVSPDDAGCTWAPEAIYDPETKDYLVFWASPTRNEKPMKHRIWAARTKDFKTFDKPFVYIEKPNAVIDTTIVQEKGTYYRFTKDEHTKETLMESSKKLMGPWQDVTDFSLKNLRGYEGPTCFVIKPGTPTTPATWALLLDYYSRGQGYQPFITENIGGGQFTAASDIKFPYRFRHGAVIPITLAEYARLKKAYPTKP